jgi:hypothetical protein
MNRRWDCIKKRMPENVPIKGAEIGVWKGQMSHKLLTIMPNLQLTMVDWWQAPPPGHSYFDGSIKIARMSDKELEDAYQETVRRNREFSDRTIIIRMESTKAAEGIKDSIFDFVFFDGDHSYDGQTRDLIAWFPKVKRGGWIGGHDFDHPQQGRVKDAVLDFFKGLDIEIDENRTWFLKKA